MDFKNKLILAPLAQVNDIAFRVLCKRYGADIIYSEMVNANALARNNKATQVMTNCDKEEHPFGIQLFGTKLDNITKAALFIQDKCEFIDFNLGCPATKIIRQGAGSALMQRPKKVFDIIKTLTEISNKPITAKIRTGYKKKNYLEIAKQIEDAGAVAIAVHPRTMSQGYQGKADWNVIKEVKENVKIPVIGNGDIWTVDDSIRIKKETNCDSIMIGRGAMGNPYLFKQIKHFQATGEKLPDQNKQEKINMFKEYLVLAEKHNIEPFAQIKMQSLYFLKGFEDSAKLRNSIQRIKTLKELKKLLD